MRLLPILIGVTVRSQSAEIHIVRPIDKLENKLRIQCSTTKRPDDRNCRCSRSNFSFIRVKGKTENAIFNLAFTEFH